MYANNTDISNPNYFEYDVAPVFGSTCPTITSTQRTQVKLLQEIGTGDSLCFLVYFCRDTRYGVFLMCLELPTDITSLLLTVDLILTSLFGFFTPIPTLQAINQTDCVFLNTCPP